MNPKYKTKGKIKEVSSDEEDNNLGYDPDEKAKIFPGLAMPDDPDWHEKNEKDTKIAIDTMVQLEDLESMLRSKKKEAIEKKTSKTNKRHSSRSNSRSSKRRRSRSNSPPYRRRRSRSHSPKRDRERDRGHGRNRSRDRARNRSRDRYIGRDRDREGYVKEELDEKPVLYKIYNGRITNLRDFGAFVSLEGVKGRVEGMVHLHRE